MPFMPTLASWLLSKLVVLLHVFELYFTDPPESGGYATVHRDMLSTTHQFSGRRGGSRPLCSQLSKYIARPKKGSLVVV
jgi:hypothetical protein